MEITKEELELLLKQDGLVVVDFWASWCGPCRMMKSVYDKFAEDNKNTPGVSIHTMSIETNEGVGPLYGLKSIPGFVYFKNGVEVDRLMGRQNNKALQEKLDAHV